MKKINHFICYILITLSPLILFGCSMSGWWVDGAY